MSKTFNSLKFENAFGCRYVNPTFFKCNSSRPETPENKQIEEVSKFESDKFSTLKLFILNIFCNSEPVKIFFDKSKKLPWDCQRKLHLEYYYSMHLVF